MNVESVYIYEEYCISNIKENVGTPSKGDDKNEDKQEGMGGGPR